MTETPAELQLSQAGGALFFDRLGPLAMLREVSIARDIDGLFCVSVLGRLLVRYQGELDARVLTEPRDVFPRQLRVREGQSAHPLLAPVMKAHPISPPVDRVEVLLAEARAAWREWVERQTARRKPPRH